MPYPLWIYETARYNGRIKYGLYAGRQKRSIGEDLMTTKERTFAKNEIDNLFAMATNGGILQSTKEELERYAVMLCSVEARDHRRDPEFIPLGETVRTLLILRMSEEANKEATWISIIALVVAIVALGLSAVQAFPVLQAFFH